MSERNPGVRADPLFVAVTRPPMRWGVAYPALLVNFVVVVEIFLVSKNLLTLLIALPVHGLFAVLCARDARFFDLLVLWIATRLPAYLGNARHWRASSYSALSLDAPNRNGLRRSIPVARVLTLRRGAL